eukprot:TRINITY_DN12553_c0_g1_i1.p2 TRINITY_DN12553_c0_g1~~TRINITY_DN12553_c0_g1_i1.p2  ORF type:complete len:320 (+),score=98.21 TRINITY_DN12553_c0_g1_i1:123-962(+)
MQYVTGVISSATGMATGALSRAAYGTDDDHEYQVPCGRPPVLPREPAEAQRLADEQFYRAFLGVMDDPRWDLVQWDDPEKAKGGDLRLWSKPQDWSFHFIKATLTIPNVRPKDVIDLVASEDLATRRRFSADLTELDYLERLPGGATVTRVTYYVPPPIAPRQMLFLNSAKESPDGTMEVWGSSVVDERWAEGGAFSKEVRARCFWGWRARPVGDGDACLVSYFSSSDPAGGLPNFIFSFAKMAVSKELTALRAVLRGETVQQSGVTAEELQALGPATQ